MKDLPRIRTDVVGSLLRPGPLKRARRRYDQGEIGAEELRRVEDEAIRQAVRLQEDVGLEVVTDGEYRRLNFQDSFVASVAGFDARPADFQFVTRLAEGGKRLQRWDRAYQVADGAAILQRRPVKERLRLIRNLPLEEYGFISRFARKPIKVTLIGPDRITQRFDHQASAAVYAEVEEFLADVVRIEREMVKALADSGCRYVQIDAPGYTACTLGGNNHQVNNELSIVSPECSPRNVPERHRLRHEGHRIADAVAPVLWPYGASSRSSLRRSGHFPGFEEY